MKTSKMIVATALTATLFALGACSKSDELNGVDLTKPIDLRMESAVVMTRSLISEGATTFEAGDKIGIYLGAPDKDGNATALTSGMYQNMEYTLDAGTWTGTPHLLAERHAEAHALCLLPLCRHRRNGRGRRQAAREHCPRPECRCRHGL